MTEFIDVTCSQEAGTLTIDDETMHRPAFAVIDVTDLWGPPKLRGADLLIPGAEGVRPLTRRITVVEKNLRMLIDGRFDPTDDSATTNAVQGLADILDWLTANLVTPPGSLEGTRTAVLTSPDGSSSKTAAVTVLGVTPGTKVGPLWRATLDLSIPAGVLVPVP